MKQHSDGMKVFFSYGHDCAELVLKIRDDLCRLGFEVWIDTSEIREGNDWRERITSGILASDSVMAFLSKHALRKNGVCLNELSIAVGCKYGHIKTVLLEPEIDHLIPPTISGVQYFDMSGWRVLKARDAAAFDAWYQQKLGEIVELLCSREAAQMNSQLKYLEQMLSPAMWQTRQQSVLQKLYIPRVEAERELEAWLRDPHGSRAFLLYGEPGCGKSSFLINFHHHNHESCAIAFCDWKRKSRDKLSEIIRSIAFQLATKLPAYRSALVWHLENRELGLQEGDEAELFRRLIVNPLHGAIALEGEMHVILIDGLNEMNEKTVNPLAEILAEEGESLPPFIRFIITARRCAIVPRYFAGSAAYEFQTASDSAIATVRDFYASELEDELEPFDEMERDEILDTLARRSEGNFLFAELCAKAIREHKMSLSELSAVPCDLNGIYYRWFTLLFPDEDVYYEKYYTPLTVLCAVEDPVPLDLLRAVMGWSPPELNGFMKLLKDFLKCQENAFGKKTVTLFHSSMRAWLCGDDAGCFELDAQEGLELLKQQLMRLFRQDAITPYQCKLLISVLEKTGDDSSRRQIYGSSFFFNQYQALAKAYEGVRGGYHKAILIYTHLREICIGLPSEENQRFLRTVYPFVMSRCFCQIGDYDTAGALLSENLPSLEASLSDEDLMECYYILGSVYDWLGQRGESVEIFTRLRELAARKSDSSYYLRAIAGLVWGDHFTNIDNALTRLEQFSRQHSRDTVDGQMLELIRARILLSTGQLDEALRLYDDCLLSFDFSFQKDVRGYRKNRLMLIEILPACYDMSKFEKGVQTGKQILAKIKNTGWLEECYCTSWIALNYLGMGEVAAAEKYLARAKRYLESVDRGDRSHWMSMHLLSSEAFLLSEKGDPEGSMREHLAVAELAKKCNDTWVEGDACFEIAKLMLLFGLGDGNTAQPYVARLARLAKDSRLAHLLLKSRVADALYSAVTTGQLPEEQACQLEPTAGEAALASTNYIDIYCILAFVFRRTGRNEAAQNASSHIRQLIRRPEYKNRPSALRIAQQLKNADSGYGDFNVEYCDPFDGRSNYWMRLEHLGRYLWACEACARIPEATVADIACANGYGTGLLAQRAAQVYGFDRSAEYIALAPRKDNIRYLVADLDAFEAGDLAGRFDLITCFETIEHVRQPRHLVRLLYDLLKPDGELLLSFPNAAFEKVDENGVNHDEFHLHIFSGTQLPDMLRQCGFEVLAVLGQSYCNEQCSLENDALKSGALSADALQKKHQKPAQAMLEDARALALPNGEQVDGSYSYILRCRKAAAC